MRIRIQGVSTEKSEDSCPEKNLSALSYTELPLKNVYFAVCDPEFPLSQQPTPMKITFFYDFEQQIRPFFTFSDI